MDRLLVDLGDCQFGGVRLFTPFPCSTLGVLSLLRSRGEGPPLWVLVFITFYLCDRDVDVSR